MRKYNLIFILITLLCLSNLSFAQNSQKEEKVRKFLAVSGSAEMSKTVMNQMINIFQSSYSQVQPAFWEEFKKETGTDDLLNLIIPIYVKYYTESDLDELIKFYESPVGRKTVENLPKITEESMIIGQQWGMQVSEKIMKKLKKEGHIKD